jgi:hypothetical protein
MLPAAQYPTLYEMTTLVAAGAHDGTHDFAFRLGLLLDGRERMVARSA